jgi:FtsP/CotA-like multicopper oxidase with cupredoxin domain
MKKANVRIVNNGNHAYGINSRRTGRAGIVRAFSQASSRNFTGKAVAVAAGVVVTAAIAFSFMVTPPAVAQLGSPPFANPGEVRYRADEKRLRVIMELINGEFSVPNGKTEQYRQYRGWDAANPRPTPGTSVSPGPTLRARLGDQVQIAFLNKIDKRKFPYTFVTDSKPGFSDFGCDQVGQRDPPKTGKFPYPASDKFPNCFHGSSTANIHFHGIHTSPDGLGDNVLVQVLPDPMQPDWTATFDQIFNSGEIPQKWDDLPVEFRDAQIDMVGKHDAEAAADAIKNGLPPPDPLLKKNQGLIAAGLWPEYFIGAFPNFFEIPDYNSGRFKAGQAPGTQWYHAHKHGSTSLHIRNGLAGALIIESSEEGGYDHFIRKFYEWGDTYGEHEKIFIFQQYDPTQNLERPLRVAGRGSNQVLVNGQLTPTISMKPGEVQLWRFVNATQGNTTGIIDGGTLAKGLFQTPTPGFTFVQTAQDGVQFSPTNYANQPFLNGRVPGGFKLAAGNRADLLVKAPQTTGLTPFKSGAATLFFVDVTGDLATPEKSFPNTWAEMPRFLLDLPKPGPNDIPNPTSRVKFQWEAGRTGVGPNPDPPRFMINGKQFFETGPIVDQCMPQDGLQEWVLENYTNVIAHPFHIHINPFQVIRIDTPTAQNTYSPPYAPKDNFVWQDVIAIPPAVISSDGTQITPGRVTIRQAYPDFTGTFVLHCHILAHEDRGMMQLVRIVPLANYPKACQGNTPDHH